MASNLLETIQQIVDAQMGAYGLADYRLGIVSKASPLEIKISDQITLYEERGQILLTEQVLRKRLDLTHVHQVLGDADKDFGPAEHKHAIDFDSQAALTKLITITEGLAVDDPVLLLQVSRNQLYIVLSKIRDKKSVIINKDDKWAWS